MIGPKMNIRIRKSGGVWRHHNPWKARRQLQIQFCKPKSDWNWFSSDEFGAIFNVRNAGNGACTPKPGTSSGRVAVLWTSRSIIWRWPAEDLCRKPPGGSTFTFARCYIQSYLNLMLVHPIIKWYLGSGIWNAVNCWQITGKRPFGALLDLPMNERGSYSWRDRANTPITRWHHGSPLKWLISRVTSPNYIT